MTNSEKAYVEEILCMIKVIIAIQLYSHGFKGTAIVFIVWAAFDFYCGIKYAIKGVISKRAKNKPRLVDRKETV